MRARIHTGVSFVLAVSVCVAGATAARGDGGTSAVQVTNAIGSVPLDLLAASQGVTSTSDADSAAVTTNQGTTVDVAKNASHGVGVTASDGNGGQVALTFDLPNTGAAQNGTSTAPGVVAFPTATTHANGVQADEGGAVRLLTILNGPAAPEEYHYELDLPPGSSMEKQSDGSIKISTPQGESHIQSPWAYDADGDMVWTQFFTDGVSGIDLVVNHWGEDVTYPITADPVWIVGALVAAFTWALKRALITCGIGYLQGAAQQALFHGWVWRDIKRAGREGCVGNLLGGAFKSWIKR